MEGCTIEALYQNALEQVQKAGRGRTFRSVGIPVALVWPFILIKGMLMPSILHKFLLGLAKNLMSEF
jgi:hypothetical protein